MSLNNVQRAPGSTGTCQDKEMKKTPPKNRANVRPANVDPDIELLAVSGLGPRWRLVAGSVSKTDCPACLAAKAAPCSSRDGKRRPTCPDRLYAHAAALRRERNPVHPGLDVTLRLAMRANPGDESVLRRAIAHGLVRLSVGQDSAPRWVDAC